MSEIKREVKDLLQKMKNKIIEHGVEPELTEFEAIAEVERLQSQLAEKDKEIAELRAALEFYADPETYIESEDSDPETGYFDPASHFDIKSVAIQALQNVKKEG